jgi:hypothetical protein
MFINNVSDEMLNKTKDDLKKDYHEITTLFDITEDLAMTVESQFVANPDEQINLVEALIDSIGDSADVLTEEYINVLEKPVKHKNSKSRIEAALRKIFMAMDEYRQRVQDRGKRLANNMWNIADPVVDKLQKHMEKIIVIFLNLLDLSLERIMHKNQIEELKRNEIQVAQRLLQLGY